MTTDIQEKELDLLCDLVIMKTREAIEATERAIAKTERTIEQLGKSEKALLANLGLKSIEQIS